MNSQNENSLKVPEYIFFDVKEQLSLIQTFKFEKDGNCFFINEKDIINILTDIFEDISNCPEEIICRVNLDLLISHGLKNNGLVTDFGLHFLQLCNVVKYNIISELQHLNFKELLKRNNGFLDYYFHSLKGNIVVLRYLGTKHD
jgi:hypothetical protein